MHALKLKAHIDSSHRIEIQLPIDAPEGNAEVIILLPDAPSPAEKGLREFFDNLDRHPPQRLYSKEEIDACVIPKALRDQLGLRESDEMLAQIEDGAARLKRAQALIEKYCPAQPGESVVDEFIAERRNAEDDE